MALTQQQIEQRLLLGHEGFYFTGGESLRVTSLNSITGVTIAGHGRFLPVSEMRPTDVALNHTPNTDRSAASSDHVMGEGWLQSLTLIVSGGSPVVGSTFIRVDVVRGGGASSTVLATLVQGFVTAGSRLAWPGSALADPVSGRGRLRVVTGSDPAAGAEISETVPTGARWRLISAQFTLVTDATVATRIAILLFDDGTTVYARGNPSAGQAASLQITYSYGASTFVQTTASQSFPSVFPAGLTLLAGHRIRTQTPSFQAADNYSAPAFLVEEWLEG